MMRLFLLISFLIVMSQGAAQTAMISIAGRTVLLSDCPLVLPAEPVETERKAAAELQKYVAMITGEQLHVVTEQTKVQPVEIVLGRSKHFPLTIELFTLDPDGFVIATDGNRLCIAGGTDKGVLYGVYELLEKYLGCRFPAPGAERIPVSDTLQIPELMVRENPAFASREVHYAGMTDPDFAGKMRTDRHAWNGSWHWGMWVHTMFTLVPPEVYFESHPEYFALMAGKRTKTQLCLTNDDVLRITINELDRLMQQNPEAKYWSVSQMDTYGACECDSCRAIDEYEGSQSGSMISFVNRVAAAFPDKVISTLAYQYTRRAPKHIRPASNVNIMLCTIECDRSNPIEADTSAGSFISDIRDWSKISGDILVWDYVIQFTNMIAPFPNLHVLQPNIQLFEKYGVNAVFEQGANKTYTENQEMRQYLLAKLLWNPGLDVDSLSTGFLEDFYGLAGPWIRRYQQRMEQALVASGKTLWIYAGPMQETDSFLDPGDMAAYGHYFDEAEKAVRGDTTLIRRVAMARLPLRYAILEIARKNITGAAGFLVEEDGKMKLRKEMEVQLDEFVNLANLYGVKAIHEQGLTPDQYRVKVTDFFRNAWSAHMAKGKTYSLAVPPASKYSAEGAGTLTDGKQGSENYHVLWQGFEGADLEAVIDLGGIAEFNYVGAEFIQDLTSWIFYPTGMTVAVSDDLNVFRPVAEFDSLSFPDKLIIAETGKTIAMTKARYVKFTARNIKQCPAWHIGHGGTAWLFADELIVDRR